MSNSFPGDSSHHGTNHHKHSLEKLEDGGRWYFSRKEIEEHSPSRLDNIDLKKETYLRKSYCTFLQDLGMRLKVPQLTIATAIIFCHRFFLRQSHAKNDRRTIATVCMFLAGKVEETPRPLKDVILVSYEIIHKKDPEAVQRIKQKEIYEQQKELILIGERVVLATLGFDLNVQHPYKPLVDAIKKFKVAQNALAQVAWNFVNDGLRTSLCLQFKPHHIAAGAIFLAAKFLKVKLPSDGEKVWWQEFDVTPRQLEEVSNQMLELYEQNRVPPSANNEAEGSTVCDVPNSKAAKEEPAVTNSLSQASRPGGTSKSTSHASGPPRTTHAQGNEYASGEIKNSSPDCDSKGNEMDNAQTSSQNTAHVKEDQERNVANSSEGGKLKHFSQNLDNREGTVGQSPQDAIKKIDKDKFKAAIEKRKKAGANVARKTDILDEDDLIERELEAGIELAAERQQNRSKSSDQEDDSNRETQEEGEVPDDMDLGSGSPKPSSSRKRKSRSPDGRRNDPSGSHHYSNHDYIDERSRGNRHGYVEREHKRHVPENHL